MLNKRITFTKNKINIGNVSYKFSEVTVRAVDKALMHLKKYKEVYKCYVVYLALCMTPALGELSIELITEFMHAIAVVPFQTVLQECFQIALTIAKWIAIVCCMYRVTKIMILDAYNRAKQKYNI